MNKNDIHELIYLVIDGEATETERSVLFRQMSDDPALQDEFQDAINISRNIDIEKKSAAPSLALTTALFGKAGISTDYLKPAAGKPTPMPKSAPKSGIAPHSFLSKVFVGKLAGGLALFTLGLVCSFIVFKLSGNKPSVLQSSRIANALEKTAPPPPVVSENKTDKAVNNGGIYQHSNTPGRRSVIIIPSSAEPVIQKENGILSDNNIASQYESRQIAYSELPLKNITHFGNTGNTDMEISPGLPGGDIEFEEAANPIKGFSFAVTGIGGLAFMPGRQLINSAPPNINNIAGEISYYLTDNSSVGIQGGIETYPIFVMEKNNNPVPTNSLAYLGGFYRLDIGSYYMGGNIVPNIKILAGGTRTGLMLKESAGLSWYPENMIGLTFGLENTGIFSTYNSTLDYTNKIGFYYGMNIKF